jgi:phosphoribosylamine--glycine ligase
MAQWDERAALGVVMAADGYPGAYEKGRPITGLDRDPGPDVKVFHAGTAERDGQVVTAGGRVLCVTALGERVSDAQRAAYAACEHIHWDGAFLRRDIGHRAIAREAG